MEIVNIHAAKTNLSKLIEQALAGEEVIIGRNGKPVIKLTPYEASPEPAPPSKKQTRQAGQLKGQIWFAPDYDEADAMIQKMFDESEIFPKG
jgi:prevent-host-death family protein